MSESIANGRGATQDWIDIVATLWNTTRHDAFAHRLQTERLVASQPKGLRTLTIVLSERRDVLDSEWKSLLPEWINACRDRDLIVATRARQWLRSAKDQQLIDAICRDVWRTDDAESKSAARESGYVPSDDVEKTLYYFAIEDWNQFERADPGLSRLTEAYETLTVPVKKRFQEIALRSSRLDLVVAMTMNFDAETITKLSGDEFEVAFQILLANGEWSQLRRIAAEIPARYNGSMWIRILEAGKQVPEQLWQLAHASPIRISLNCLHALKLQNWKPQEADQVRAAESLYALMTCEIAVDHTPILLRRLKSPERPSFGANVGLVSHTPGYESYCRFDWQSHSVHFSTLIPWKVSHVVTGGTNARLLLWRTDEVRSSYDPSVGVTEFVTLYPDVLFDHFPFSIGVDELRTQLSLLDEYSTDSDRGFAECVLAIVTWAQQQQRLSVPTAEAGRFSIVSHQDSDENEKESAAVRCVKAG